MVRRPPRSTRTDTLFPYTTLFRSGRQADHIALSPRLDDAVDELEELCRAEDRIGDAGGLDQLLLGHLRPKVAALEKALRADDRESHMMPHAGGRLRREKVAAGRLEELHRSAERRGGKECVSTCRSRW